MKIGFDDDEPIERENELYMIWYREHDIIPTLHQRPSPVGRKAREKTFRSGRMQLIDALERSHGQRSLTPCAITTLPPSLTTRGKGASPWPPQIPPILAPPGRGGGQANPSLNLVLGQFLWMNNHDRCVRNP